MKKYLFLGRYQGNDYDIEKSDSVLWIFEAENFEAAFEKVLEKYDYLGYSGDRELYTAFELVDDMPHYKEFTIERD